MTKRKEPCLRYLLYTALVLSIGLTGCMDITMKFKIEQDGSSVVNMQLSMLEDRYQMLMAQGQQTGADFSMFNKAEVERMAQQFNGEVLNFKNDVVDGKRDIDVAFRFRDGVNTMPNMAQGQVSIDKNDDGTMTLRFLDGSMVEQFSAMEEETLNQQFEMMRPMMSGLRFQVVLAAPDIQDSNMPVDGNQAEFVMDYDKDWADKPTGEMVSAFMNMLQPKWVTFSAVE